jgi:YggT family protein
MKGNLAVIPALLVIMVLFVIINSALSLLLAVLGGADFNIVGILWKSFLMFLACIADIVQYLSWAIIIRALLSWFSPDPRNILVQLVYYVTEPILAPLRRVIPPVGMFDLSAFAAIFGLFALQQVLRSLIISLQGLF